MSESLLDRLSFSQPLSFGDTKWSTLPDKTGVYVILDGNELVYVGMAGRSGKGSLRRRLADHARGQVVNMFVQYLLFDRILPLPDPPRTPQAATIRCRAYIRSNCYFRLLVVEDTREAFRLEKELKTDLRPTFNRR